MIIWLTGTVGEYPLGQQRAFYDALTELGEAGYMGRHVVLAPRPLLQHLSKLNGISARGQAYFARLFAEFTQLRHLFSVSHRVTVSPTAHGEIELAGVWIVPLERFAVPELMLTSEVVCENDTDFDVYRAFAFSAVREMFPDCELAVRSRAGGGSGTAAVLSRLVASRNPPTLCIVDSDRCHALAGEGSTARACRRVRLNGWNTQLRVLTSRELENILPLTLVDQHVAESVGQDHKIMAMRNVARDIADYVCLKSGESVCRFHAVANSEAGYARTILALKETARSLPKFVACGDNCGACDCDIVPRLGDQFLQNFARWINTGSNWRRIPSIGEWSVDLREAVRDFVLLAVSLPRKA